MNEVTTHPRIELEAAQAAIEWKARFAAELSLAAREVANGVPFVTVEHYSRALPIAVARLMQAFENQSVEFTDAQRQVA